MKTVVYGPVDGGRPTFSARRQLRQHSGTGDRPVGNISGWDPSNPQSAALTSIVFPEGIRDPYVENWFLGVQHATGSSLPSEMNYVGTAGRKLFRAESVNRVPGAKLPEGTCVTDNFGRKLCSQVDTNLDPSSGLQINLQGVLNPNYGRLSVWQKSVNSIYQGLQASVKKKASHGLEFGRNYTWSHAIDGGSTWHSGSTTANGLAAGDSFSTDATQPGLDRGNSTFDIRHRVSLRYVWELPFFHLAMTGCGGHAQRLATERHLVVPNRRPLDSISRRVIRPSTLQELTPGACSAPTFDPNSASTPDRTTTWMERPTTVPMRSLIM